MFLVHVVGESLQYWFLLAFKSLVTVFGLWYGLWSVTSFLPQEGIQFLSEQGVFIFPHESLERKMLQMQELWDFAVSWS